MAFTEILAIIVLSYIAGIVSTVIFALNMASGKHNKREEMNDAEKNEVTQKESN